MSALLQPLPALCLWGLWLAAFPTLAGAPTRPDATMPVGDIRGPGCVRTPRDPPGNHPAGPSAADDDHSSEQNPAWRCQRHDIRSDGAHVGSHPAASGSCPEAADQVAREVEAITRRIPKDAALIPHVQTTLYLLLRIIAGLSTPDCQSDPDAQAELALQLGTYSELLRMCQQLTDHEMECGPRLNW